MRDQDPPEAAGRPWAVPAPAGTPYHRLARTAAHRWWRPLAGSAFIITAFGIISGAVVIAFLTVTALTGDPAPGNGDSGISGNPTADVGLQLAIIAGVLPAVFAAAWVVQRRRPGGLSSVAGRLRRRWLLLCVGPALAAVVVRFVVSIVLTAMAPVAEQSPAGWVGWSAFIPAAVLILLLVPFQAASEEYVFRGWLLQGIAACTLEARTGRLGRAASAVFRTPWPAIAVSAALFMLLHGYSGPAAFQVFLFAVVAGLLAIRTGGLEAAIVLHAVNNLIAFTLPAAFGGLDRVLVQEGVPWQSAVSDMAGVGFYAVAIVWLARRRSLEARSPRLWAGAPAPPVAAAPRPAP